jgi:uncharacterized protein
VSFLKLKKFADFLYKKMRLADDIALGKGLLGGLIVGSSAVIMMYVSGKITGLSGITRSTLTADTETWQYAYVIGLISCGKFVHIYAPNLFPDSSSSNVSIPAIILAGTLVGYGTRLGSGCTSGHGICGLGRWSPRSLTAVVTFMTTGMITAAIANHPSVIPYLQADIPWKVNSFTQAILPTVLMFGVSKLFALRRSVRTAPNSASNKDSTTLKSLIAFGCSLLFGSGLVVSEMINMKRVIGFLDCFNTQRGWDITLTGVMGSGVVLTGVSFVWMVINNYQTLLDRKMMRTVLDIGFSPPNMKINAPLIVGSMLFGIGWGLLGLCPGPALVNLGAGSAIASVFVPSMFAGMLLPFDIV